MNTFMDRVNAIVAQNQPNQRMMAPAPKTVYPDQGLGALDNVVSSVPRQAELMNQPHMLAYINPQEEQMLRDAGGAGIPGPDGIPVYGFWSSTFGGGNSFSQSVNNISTPSDGNTYVGGQSTSTNTNTNTNTNTGSTDNKSSGGRNLDADLGYGGTKKTVTASDLISGNNTSVYPNTGGGSVTVKTGSSLDTILGTNSKTPDTIMGTNLVSDYDSPSEKRRRERKLAEQKRRDEAAAAKIAAELAEEKRLADIEAARIAEQERLAGIAEQERLAGIAAAAKLAEEERLAGIAAELAEEKRLAGIAAELAEQERLDGIAAAELAEQVAAELAEQERLDGIEAARIAEQKRIDDQRVDLAENTVTTNLTNNYTGKNSVLESIANLITPGDGAKYENGQLINTNTGESLAGGGYSTNAAGQKDYIYGVADDFSNNVTVDTTGMTEFDANAARVRQELTESIPPSMAEYLASFIPGQVVPILGGYIASKMLQSGIEERKDVMELEFQALKDGAEPLFNSEGEYVGHDTGSTDKYNLNYDPTGGNTNIGALPNTTQTLTDEQKAAYEQYGNSMKDSGVLNIGGKQTPDDPDIVGNTPILEYNGESGGYTVVGGLDPNSDPSLSYNADGTLHIPYGGEDPHTINNSDFKTDFTPNGAAVLNELGKDHLLKTGDDSKMVVGSDDGGYEYVDGTKITDAKLEVAVKEAVSEGILSEDVLDVLDLETVSAGENAAVSEEVITSIFNRYYKGGSGMGMPPWLRKYASGVSINQLLEKVNIEGVEYYKTPEGKYIDTSELAGSANLGEEKVS